MTQNIEIDTHLVLNLLLLDNQLVMSQYGSPRTFKRGKRKLLLIFLPIIK